MEYITVDRENIDREHICCCIADKKGENGVALKKAWMKDRFEEGLVFRRSNTRGKVFIEYIPAENAWYPITADGYMHINCFWVSGQYKGHGHSNELLDYCIQDARTKGKSGVTIIASDKKRGFLSDPDYMAYKGFRAVDEADPFSYCTICRSQRVHLCRRSGSAQNTGKPMSRVWSSTIPANVLTPQSTPLSSSLPQGGTDTLSVCIRLRPKSRHRMRPPLSLPTASFFNGEFVTNEILSEKKFEKFLQQHGL